MTSDRWLLEDDPLTKTRTWFVPGADGEGFTLVTEQDITQLLELAKASANAGDRHSPWGEGQLVARIPNTVLFDLQRQGILDDQERFRAWLNDPDNRVFRLRAGKV